MKYMIHTSPKREWYVNKYLIPDLHDKGIVDDDIIVWSDNHGYGNLTSFVKSCEYINNRFPEDAAIWHLQDDIVLCKDFYDRTHDIDYSSIICGFYERSAIKNHPEWFCSDQTPKTMCSSFQCILIPNHLIADFPGWFNRKVDGKYLKGDYDYSDCANLRTAKNNCNDDIIFKKYLKECYSEQTVINLLNPLCQHVDYLLGGSTIYNRATLYITTNFDQSIVENLKHRLTKENYG